MTAPLASQLQFSKTACSGELPHRQQTSAQDPTLNVRTSFGGQGLDVLCYFYVVLIKGRYILTYTLYFLPFHANLEKFKCKQYIMLIGRALLLSEKFYKLSRF